MSIKPEELKPVAWRTMDCPPKEEDGTVLVWAENMPVSMGRCQDGYYVFTECEDLHNYFEGNEVWLTEHWTLWMHLPNPCGKSLPATHRIVPVELLERCTEQLLEGAEAHQSLNDEFGNSSRIAPGRIACETLSDELRAIIDKEPTCPSA